jgi:hypothetical protein|tara:strand:+ start:652 stop:909 length:258 start_codon:yes stop_codon:yes gene_type:complete
MTQYKDEVERHAELLAAEEWGKQVKYLHAGSGIIEVAYNNGQKHFEETATGKKWQTGVDYNTESLVDKFNRYMNDVSVGKEPYGK